MKPRPRLAGLAGVLAGLGLALEFAFFMASGWTADAFGNADAALVLFAEGGSALRAAGFIGVINLALLVLFLAGLAAQLYAAAPTRIAGMLCFGLIGAAAHALVPIGLWAGTPALVSLAAGEPELARGAWSGFALAQSAASGAGYFFGGAALLLAGWGMLASRTSASRLGYVGLAAGIAGMAGVLGQGTSLAGVSAALFIPGLLLTIAFRVLAGYALWRERV